MRQSRILWIPVLLGAVLCTAPSPFALKAEVRFDCAKAINYHLRDLLNARVDVRDFSRIAEETKVSYLLAEAFYGLKYVLRNSFSELSQKQKQACLDDSAQYRHELYTYLVQRFSNLEPILFQKEMAKLLAFGGRKEKMETLDLFEAFEIRYIENIFLELRKRLESTDWKDYGADKPKLERWSAEWKKLLGIYSPAAVHFEKRRVAVDAFIQSDHDVRVMLPLEVEIYLFHELAHLADPAGIPNSTEKKVNSEVHAWKETMLFVSYLEKSGEKIPERFLEIRSEIKILGLEDWVKSVQASESI